MSSMFLVYCHVCYIFVSYCNLECTEVYDSRLKSFIAVY